MNDSLTLSTGTNMNDSLTPQEVITLRGLRDRGFAVCVFTAEEVGDAPPDQVEDGMCQQGWSVINHYNDDVSL